eukprot:8287049-Heterocapsa_arctica.AAC.1
MPGSISPRGAAGGACNRAKRPKTEIGQQIHKQEQLSEEQATGPRGGTEKIRKLLHEGTMYRGLSCRAT